MKRKEQTTNKYSIKFSDCLFKICPVNRYAAQKQCWAEQKARQTAGTSHMGEDMLKRLKVIIKGRIYAIFCCIKFGSVLDFGYVRVLSLLKTETFIALKFSAHKTFYPTIKMKLENICKSYKKQEEICKVYIFISKIFFLPL